MKINNQGLELIKKFEGLNLRVYLDAKNIKTVGYGHTGKSVNEMQVGDTITMSQANKYLYGDIEYAEKQVDKYSGYNFNDNEYSALVSFAFNIGSIDQLTNNGTRDKKIIAKKMLEYCNCNHQRLQGLVNRRKAEQELFLKNDKNI